MKEYLFDEKTGKYISEKEANIDSWMTEIKGEPVYWLYPFATFEVPPEKEGFTAYYRGAGWELVADPTLDELKALKLKEIGAWTAGKIVGGFVSSASGEEVTYDSDKDTQITMTGISVNVETDTFAKNYPDGCPVRGYAKGSDVKEVFYLSPKEVLQWMADLYMHVGTCKMLGWQKQQEVSKAKTQKQLEAIILE